MIVSIIGTRPQYVKATALQEAFIEKKVPHIVIDTFQHYHSSLQASIIDLNKRTTANIVKQPNTLQQLISNIDQQIKPFLKKTNWIIVYGDTHSALAAAIVANKYKIKMAHVEAGERSFNSAMLEEVNRIVIDNLADICFCVNKKAVNFLTKEKVKAKKIIVGDLQYDMFVKTKQQINTVFTKPYYFFTIHRAQNTQSVEQLQRIIDAVATAKHDILWPVHPRVKKMLQQIKVPANFIVTNPLDYHSTINYILFSQGVITDSGGLQKEAYWAQVKCITLRPETEWTETLNGGWNTLLPSITPNAFKQAVLIKPNPQKWSAAAFGNGNAALKIVNQLEKYSN